MLQLPQIESLHEEKSVCLLSSSPSAFMSCWLPQSRLAAVLQMMRLREENEALMDSLVRTKVELADTQGGRGCLTSAMQGDKWKRRLPMEPEEESRLA